MFFQATLARAFISSLSLRGDDDFADRLNYYHTPVMLAVACVLISAKQYGGTPIECWINPHSKESMEEYIESYCWIQNTYWIPMYENIPDDHRTREEKQISYYQWVPFVLIAEALMFALPCMVWRLMNWQSGINIQNMVTASIETKAIMDEDEKEKAINSLANSFLDFIDMQDYDGACYRETSLFGKFKLSRFLRGHYITCLYLSTKLIYTLNIVCQFIILNVTLKSDEYFLFGVQVLTDLWNGKPWSESGHFPRVTLCDFEVRNLANLNRYTVQCALLINFINEKVFAFFWMWYFVLAIITIASTVVWTVNCTFHSEKIDYILKFLHIADGTERKRSANENARHKVYTESFDKCPIKRQIQRILPPSQHLLERFVLDFLKSDGVFVLRLMSNHAGDIIVMNIVLKVWKEFQGRNFHEFIHYEKGTQVIIHANNGSAEMYANDLTNLNKRTTEVCLDTISNHTKTNIVPSSSVNNNEMYMSTIDQLN
uniref:Innexin n=1 Tax=Rhabditophanes sp. KR3021 TaxID=114890 RepID=A0AC35U0F1_9BILA